MQGALLSEVRGLVLEASRLFSTGEELRVSAKGAKDYVTQVDLAVSAFLSNRLPGLLPGSRVISEEDTQAPPLDDGYCWIIDPVDGTTNLIYGLPLYAISIGLFWQREPVLGVVYNPATGEMFSGAKGEGAYLNGEPIQVCGDDSIEGTLVLAETNPYGDRTRSRTTEVIGRVFLDCIDYRVTGSAALDVCYVACGRGGVFLSESLEAWDCAGGCAILLEAGGRFTDWQGEPFPFGKKGDSTFLASNGILHDRALDYTRR